MADVTLTQQFYADTLDQLVSAMRTQSMGRVHAQHLHAACVPLDAACPMLSTTAGSASAGYGMRMPEDGWKHSACMSPCQRQPARMGTPCRGAVVFVSLLRMLRITMSACVP